MRTRSNPWTPPPSTSGGGTGNKTPVDLTKTKVHKCMPLPTPPPILGMCRASLMRNGQSRWKATIGCETPPAREEIFFQHWH